MYIASKFIIEILAICALLCVLDTKGLLCYVKLGSPSVIDIFDIFF